MNKRKLEFIFAGPHFSILKQLYRIEARQMATQAEIDALTTRLGDVGSQLSRGLGEVLGTIQDLKEQLEAGNTVDLSALESQVNSIAETAQALDDVVPDVIPDPEPLPDEDELPFEGDEEGDL